MKQLFFYSVIRFRPLLETGEFANVGIVALSAQSGRIKYQLAHRRFRRVTQFFDNVSASTYSETMEILKEKLVDAVDLARSNPDSADVLFQSVVGVRDGVITFSDVRSMVAPDLDTAVEISFDRLVRRNVDTYEYREVGIVRSIKNDLKALNIKSFTSKYIDDDLMPVKLPLVSEGVETYVIKPMAFDQKTTISIIDHANLWTDRFKYFLSKGRLKKENVLIPVEMPVFDDDLMVEASIYATSKIAELPVKIVEFGTALAVEEIRRFAARGDVYSGGIGRHHWN
ncbi:DUF3037 domain-containing protein [Sphingomonas koreensis]|uniref:DUF3037 domain-containing protein n=1 Tax=Sphingomonas koreensis TaxID=93064 RepID=UPI000ACEEF48|nr:DUF3037 domain-containing protein [Sphingomonas koreensis]PJI87025.1 Protein of unknown function (DUF3037) [Sphingomonas koreensis]